MGGRCTTTCGIYNFAKNCSSPSDQWGRKIPTDFQIPPQVLFITFRVYNEKKKNGCTVQNYLIATSNQQSRTYQSCLRTACPFSDSTLKLLVFAGMMKKTTTVTSFRWTCRDGDDRFPLDVYNTTLPKRHKTNTASPAADSSVWTVIQGKYLLLCLRTHSAQQWRRWGFYPSWSPGDYRDNKD